MSGLRRASVASLMALLALGTGDASEVVEVEAWQLHNSFWMSLHQTLIAHASDMEVAPMEGLSSEEAAAWAEAVAAYREAGGEGSMTFARPMQITTDALSQVADDAVRPDSDAPLAEALVKAAPAYRAHAWPADEAAARFFIAYAASMLEEVGAGLVQRHVAVYGTPWPERVRVYVTPYAGTYGAYTIVGRAGGVITTMSCRDAGYQGVRVLEMIPHEASHAIVSPNDGTVAEAIVAAAERHGVAPPRSLWHALLFSTSGELARRRLAELGFAGYEPLADEVIGRAWPRYREPIQRHWWPYLEGSGTLGAAIDAIVADIARGAPDPP